MLPNSTFIAIAGDYIREGILLLFKYHFDLVFRENELHVFTNIIFDILNSKVSVIPQPKISCYVSKYTSNLWQGNEKIVRNVLEKNGFKLNVNCFHEPFITIMEDGCEIDRFRPDFLIENNTQRILIEVSKIGKNTMRERLNKLASRFEIYKRLLKYKTVLVLFSEEKLLENETDRLRRNCDYILINDVDKLVDILRSG